MSEYPFSKQGLEKSTSEENTLFYFKYYLQSQSKLISVSRCVQLQLKKYTAIAVPFNRIASVISVYSVKHPIHWRVNLIDKFYKRSKFKYCIICIYQQLSNNTMNKIYAKDWFEKINIS